jgi:hypothetical protein
VRSLTWGGDGSPGSREAEAEAEGGEGFYIARSGRRTDFLVFWGGFQGDLTTWGLAQTAVIR